MIVSRTNRGSHQLVTGISERSFQQNIQSGKLLLGDFSVGPAERDEVG